MHIPFDNRDAKNSNDDANRIPSVAHLRQPQPCQASDQPATSAARKLASPGRWINPSTRPDPEFVPTRRTGIHLGQVQACSRRTHLDERRVFRFHALNRNRQPNNLRANVPGNNKRQGLAYWVEFVTSFRFFPTANRHECTRIRSLYSRPLASIRGFLFLWRFGGAVLLLGTRTGFKIKRRGEVLGWLIILRRNSTLTSPRAAKS